jgi:alkanesulfonate monooxygenase SsuD/methylene tetrahydromethanopterin reductase-like flavin-dependent oxidoreductase (luciferase family)
VLPGGDAAHQLRQAELAEAHGWDGVFVWEAAYGVDPWTLLAAMAARTSRIRLGTMLTPLPWRRPWKVASQVVTLDQLSQGRAILSVGLGATSSELGNTGEVLERRPRAQMLDEGIDLVRGLWEGRLRFEGRHYRMDLEARTDLATVGRPVQTRIPIWVVGVWPALPSMRRVLRCDGILPVHMVDREQAEMTPDVIREMRRWLQDNGRSPDGFDVVMEGETQADDATRWQETLGPLAEAGVTWWIESRWALPHESPQRMAEVIERIEAGPPRV